MTVQSKMDPEVLSMVLDTISKLEKEKLTLDTKLDMDQKGDFPMDLIRFMSGPEVGLHLIFIPAEYGGLGAGAQEIALVSEKMAKIDLAIATSFLATCLGTDPIRVAGTEEQKEKYIRRIAEEGLIVAYGVTEPEAGSNVQALKTKAERVLDDDGNIKGYLLNGQKQFITNGGVAELYTILANTPEGPSFFIVEGGAEGLVPGKHEDKHGIRASDTCPLVFEDLFVPAGNLVGGDEGKGLRESNEVFGYTRLMVAALALGGGMSALEKVIAYSKQRVQFGTTLSEKQGYTHRLLVPNAVRLEAARSYLEHVAYLLDNFQQDLQVEGSIAKYFTTEVSDAMANDAIQALGGYGYMREYEVEKIKRDTKILTIYEGTSEIQRRLISMFRLQKSVRSKGSYYREIAEELAAMPAGVGAHRLAPAVEILNDLILGARKSKLTKSQYVMFMLAEIMTWCEIAHTLCKKAVEYKGRERSTGFMAAAARLFSREAIEMLVIKGLKIARGCEKQMDELDGKLNSLNLGDIMIDSLTDMDLIAGELVKQDR